MPGIFLLKLKEVGLNCVQQQSAITIIAFTSGENDFERWKPKILAEFDGNFITKKNCFSCLYKYMYVTYSNSRVYAKLFNK